MKLNQAALKDEQDAKVLAEGDYTFEVIGAETKPSAKSADGEMTALRLRIVDEDGRKHSVKDFLGQWNYGLSKIKAFFDAVGHDSEEDLDASDMIGLTGRVHTKKGEFNGNAKAEVGWYIPRLPGEEAPVVANSASLPTDTSDDDVPF